MQHRSATRDGPVSVSVYTVYIRLSVNNTFLTSIIIGNVRSLANKMDEIRALARYQGEIHRM